MEILVVKKNETLQFYSTFFAFLNNNEDNYELNSEDIEIVSNDLVTKQKSYLDVIDRKTKEKYRLFLKYITVIEGWDCRNKTTYDINTTKLNLKELFNEEDNCNS